jgi:prophage tail gpP-like protein
LISLQVNNIPYTNFVEASLNESLDSISGDFTFRAISAHKQEFPFSVGDECVVLVDDVPKLTGFIDVMSGSYDKESHQVVIQGRSKTEDLIDSFLEEAIDFNGTVTIQSMTETVIAAAGITGMDVIVNETIEPFAEGEIESFAVGESIFDILEKYSRKRQVFITSDGKGNIVYTRNSGVKTNVQLINDGVDSNIKRANFSKDFSNRYNKYIVRAQQNPVSLFATISASDVVSQKSTPAIDTAIRDTRKLVIMSESASDKDKATERAKWEADIRRSRSTTYSATVQGHSHAGGVWSTNTIVDVNDIFVPALSSTGEMLVNSLNFTFNLESGSETTAELIAKDAYTLQASEPVGEEEVDILAGLFS